MFFKDNVNVGEHKLNKFYLLTIMIARFYQSKHFMIQDY